MLREGIHERLAEVYDEFDRHSRVTNTRYSIDSDHFNLQGYRVLDCKDYSGFLRHMGNFVKDKWVDLEIDGVSVNYDDLGKADFKAVKGSEEPIFQFTLSAIQEDDMLNEKQYKDPTNSHTLKQAQHPSSFRENTPGFGYKAGKGGKKKKKKGKKVSKENFESKLNSALIEGIGTQFTEPQVLFTRDEQLSDNSTLDLSSARNTLTGVLDQYHYALKTADDNVSNYLTNMIDNCTSQINDIDEILKSNSDE